MIAVKTKKLLSLLSASILAVSAIPMGASAEFVMGDVNQDGVFDNLDINAVTDFLSDYSDEECTEEEFIFFRKYADMNNDGYVNSDDVRLMTKMYTNLDAEAKMGDVNHNGYVDCVDATMIMIYYADLSTDNYDKYTEEEHANFKMYGNLAEDENGFIDAADANAVLICYVENSTSLQ